MALKLEEIRALADRVAASHALEVVDVEYQGGGGKHRTLRIFIEKNEAERARLQARVARLQVEREAHSKETEEGETEGEFAEVGADDDDEALLEGLPSVQNLALLSGITHEDCEAFSRDFGTVLDVEELVPGTEYLLEVSSPGLDRRLSRAEDYQRFTGSLAKLQTFEAVDGNRHWKGRIAAVREGRLVIEVTEKRPSAKGKKDTGQARVEAIEIALENVEKAHLVPEF